MNPFTLFTAPVDAFNAIAANRERILLMLLGGALVWIGVWLLIATSKPTQGAIKTVLQIAPTGKVGKVASVAAAAPAAVASTVKEAVPNG